MIAETSKIVQNAKIRN